MTALSAGMTPTLIPGPRSAHAYQQLVKSGETIYRGATVALDPATGKWVEAISTDSGQIVYGRARLGDNIDSFDNSAGTNTNELIVDSGCTLYVFGSVSTTDEGKIAYVADDQTATLTPGGPILGVVQLYSDSTHAYVMVDPFINKALAQAALLGGGVAFKCRGVITSLAANTVTAGVMTMDATGALASQDGLTPALNEVWFIQEGTTNLDNAQEAGPWQITTLGATGVANVFTRPSWWAHGAPIVQGAVIEIGGEGTGTTPRYAGTSWKSFAAKGKIIGTDAPVFWPDFLAGTYTASSGVVLNGVTTFAIRSATTSQVVATNQGTASHASTVGPPRVTTGPTAGVVGSSSLTVKAETAPGSTNTSDVGVYTVSVTNW